MNIKASLFTAALVVLFTAVALPGSLRAQGFSDIAGLFTESFQDAIDLLPPDVTSIRIGVGPAIYPEYMGDDRYKIQAAPVVSLRYRNLFEIDNNELKITALSGLLDTNTNIGKGKLRFGPLVSLDFGRKAKRSNDLIGFGNVSTSVELGAFVGYAVGPVRLRLRARHDVAGGHSGAIVKGDVALALYRDSKLALGSNLSTTWASSKYMKSYFGVSATQSAGSGLTVFTPGSGIRDLAVGASANYLISRNFSVVSSLRYARLMSGAKKSPLVKTRGSANQGSFSSYIIYSF